jgi:thiosulfate dehydrogenase [quinone] large subunit
MMESEARGEARERFREATVEQSATFTITREKTWGLTAISVAIFLLLCWLFGDGLIAPPVWNSEDWVTSPLITWLLIVLILAAGWLQAQRVPATGIALRSSVTSLTPGQVEDPAAWRLLMGNVFLSIFWLPIRFYVGRDWLSAGLHKIVDPAWMSDGSALQGFWERAVAVPEGGRPPISLDWYRQFLQFMLDNGWYAWFGKLIAIGETLVGLGLLVGALVGIAAFCGTLLNFSFMLAGTTSSNPILFGMGVFLVLAWKVAGYWGLDRWLLARFGTPWTSDERDSGRRAG